ncbi:hypothetical protein [Haloferula sp. BvORR071]|nr:hypothetical protein [Haloferula sp. BvORR071]
MTPALRIPWDHGSIAMSDLIYLILTAGFFCAALSHARFCGNL